MEEYLSISGIQHFCFCPRQWALIHLEQQWSENIRTTEGHLEHRRAHESELKEKRDNLLTVRGLRVVSYRLRLSGVCDVVEFSTDPHGITLQNQPGYGSLFRWSTSMARRKRSMPIEYSFAHRQWLWKKCWCAMCPRALCFMRRLAAEK